MRIFSSPSCIFGYSEGLFWLEIKFLFEDIIYANEKHLILFQKLEKSHFGSFFALFVEERKNYKVANF